MENNRQASLKPWKKAPQEAKAGLRTLRASTEELDKEPGEMGGRNQEPKKRTRLWLGSFATAEEAAVAYDEAARRLYGPDAYLNLPHLRITNFINPLNKSHKFKWLPSNNFISLFPPPASGLLNLNAQPSVHVIHQRLQELKKTGVFSQSSSSSSDLIKNIEAAPIMMGSQGQPSKGIPEVKAKDHVELFPEIILGDQREKKPQLDLNEFLEQLGILKKDNQPDIGESSSSLTELETCLNDDDDGVAAFTEKSFDWDMLREMHEIEDDHQGAESNSFLQACDDIDEELSFPTSIWNF